MSTSPQPDTPTRGTPGQDLHNRWRPSLSRENSPAQPAEASPSSATARTGSVPRGLDTGGLRSAMVSSAHSFSLLSTAPPSRPLVIRADPALATCFDPADKELYDLWAPKY